MGLHENPYQPPAANIPDLSFLEPGPRDLGFCANHPGVKAVESCQQCRAPLCSTCDFQFPGRLHLCPKCATTTSRPMSSGRKQMLAVSLLAAMVTTVILGLSFAGAFVEMANDEITATILGSVIMISALVGLGLSFASLDNKAGNPPLCWVAVVWNVLLGTVWILLCIAGLFMG